MAKDLNVVFAPLRRRDSTVTNAIAAHLQNNSYDRPTLILDVSRVAENFRALKAGLGNMNIHYAVKANPATQVIERLVSEGSRFDAASMGEVSLCLSCGAAPEDISFGNTVKKPADIAWAFERGIDLFAADAEAELVKIATHAPGARVYIRMLVEHSQADWPLSRKFGAPAEAVTSNTDSVTSRRKWSRPM